MTAITNNPSLPDAKSENLHLDHPTDQENLIIWTQSAEEWKDALSVEKFIEEAKYMMTIPLAKDGGLTQWILVDKTLPPDQRPVLASCETFRKRSWISDAAGNVTETITHGIASVFTSPEMRGRKYASRLMTELAKTLPTWQTEGAACAASVLYSDVGKEFYSKLGWKAFPSNGLIFEPSDNQESAAKPIYAKDLESLCKIDEVIAESELSVPSASAKYRLMIVPDHDHMLWHHRKEEFGCEFLFQRKPEVKGAIFGQPGKRVWVVWNHRFYELPSEKSSSNTLFILRLVIENESLWESDQLTEALRAVFLAAQAEAARWKLQSVDLWGPSPAVQQLMERTGIQYRHEEREKDEISSLQWYIDGSQEEEVEWVGNEKYAWC